MTEPYNEPPVNPLPPVVLALALVLIGVELVMQLGARGLAGGADAVGWRLATIQRFAFSGELLDWMLDRSQFPAGYMIRFFSYVFIHLSFVHAVFVVVFLLALGKLVGEVFGTVAFLLVFFLSGAMGALAYGLILNDPMPLVGGFPAVYGLIGAYTFLIWTSLAIEGENQMQAFNLIAVLMGIQLLFSLIFGGSNDWVADLAGFATGFAVSFFVTPGGWHRLVEKLRKR
ncbi:MAG: rhomboid family intramembrane serine protease [Rhodobacteraceae bacterium]|nr:rhomboid family intramembrane serine protease [Paracoccaceae bacterium]